MENEKVKFYKKKWFMWICLILLPPIGIILLWALHKDMKRATRIILTIVFALWSVILFVSGNSDYTPNVTETTNTTTQVEATEETTEATTAETTTQTTTTNAPTTKSKLEADGLSFHISDVRNDVTGNWKVALIAENIQMQEYALDYYNEYFKSDEEIHAIVNFNYNTTTTIKVYGDTMYVTVHEYVDGEEHDAKLISSGMTLKDYIVDKNTGEIEEIY